MVIDDFIASYCNHFPQSDSLNGKQEHSSESDLKFLSEQANAFIESYHNFLNKLWNNTLSSQIKELVVRNDETLLFGGDKLFLPETFREEMISAWLLWILEATILEDDMREKVLNTIFSKITQSDTYRQYAPGTKKTFDFSFRGARFQRELPIKAGRLDIFIEANDFIIAIENKIGEDKNFKKNVYYREELKSDKKFANKKRYYFLLVPRKDLDEYREEESEEEDEEKETPDKTPAPEQTKEQDAVLLAFPPVTWEEFLRILRKAIEENDNDNIRWKHWKTLALAFISCVEGNVLRFPLKEIKESVNASHPPTQYPIQQINEYFKYRKL